MLVQHMVLSAYCTCCYRYGTYPPMKCLISLHDDDDDDDGDDDDDEDGDGNGNGDGW